MHIHWTKILEFLDPKKTMAPMAFKHFTPNFERARTFTFVHVHVLDVRERAPPATPNFGCVRRNGKRPTPSFPRVMMGRECKDSARENSSSSGKEPFWDKRPRLSKTSN